MNRVAITRLCKSLRSLHSQLKYGQELAWGEVVNILHESLGGADNQVIRELSDLLEPIYKLEKGALGKIYLVLKPKEN